MLTELTPQVQNQIEIKCKFKKICKTVYDKEFDEVCIFRNPDIKQCQLTKDIQDNNLDSLMFKLLDKKATIKSTEIKEKDPVVCPRSLLAKATLKKSCVLKKCPFYSEKMSYNCMLIHHTIHFPDHAYMSQRVIEIGIGLNPTEYNRMVEMSVYLSRLYIILLKYTIDYLGNTTIEFNSKSVKSLLHTSPNNGVCETCSCVIDDRHRCSCISDSDLRERRIKFYTNWRKSIEKYAESLDIIKLNKMSPEKFVIEYGKTFTGLKFIRSLLWLIEIKGCKLIDVPFGYIYRTYTELFSDEEWKKAENLGLSDELNEQAYYLFMQQEKREEIYYEYQ